MNVTYFVFPPDEPYSVIQPRNLVTKVRMAYMRIAVYATSIAPLRELTCHMASHSVTFHPVEVTFPPLPQPIKAGTRFSDPEGCKAELTIDSSRSLLDDVDQRVRVHVAGCARRGRSLLCAIASWWLLQDLTVTVVSERQSSELELTESSSMMRTIVTKVDRPNPTRADSVDKTLPSDTTEVGAIGDGSDVGDRVGQYPYDDRQQEDQL